MLHFILLLMYIVRLKYFSEKLALRGQNVKLLHFIWSQFENLGQLGSAVTVYLYESAS